MATTFNLFDLIFIFFGLIFILVAFFRGFIKEMFSLLVWIVALVASYFLAPLISDLLRNQITNKIVNDISVRSVVFIAVFLGTNFAISSYVNDLHERVPNMFNRSMGFLFGIVKTLVIFGAFYSIFLNSLSLVYGEKVTKNSSKYPLWLKDAKSGRLIEISGNFLDPAISLFFEAMAKNFDKVLPQEESIKDKILDKVISDEVIESPHEKWQENDVELKKVKTDDGYSKKDIEKMNHLMEIIEK